MMILGVVSFMQPVHGYDVRRELLSWGADRWAKIQPGSIYHALKKMAEEGLLATTGTEQIGGRPERTSYEITPKGRDAFEGMLREEWWEFNQPMDPFQAAFAFLPALPRKEATAALRHRARMLRAASDGFKDMIESERTDINKPIHVRWMFELWMSRAEGEIGWCERIAAEIEAGVSYVPDNDDPAWDAYRKHVAESE
jgi:DNA-binding PadR family transcriptional regulator